MTLVKETILHMSLTPTLGLLSNPELSHGSPGAPANPEVKATAGITEDFQSGVLLLSELFEGLPLSIEQRTN